MEQSTGAVQAKRLWRWPIMIKLRFSLINFLKVKDEQQYWISNNNVDRRPLNKLSQIAIKQCFAALVSAQTLWGWKSPTQQL
ncbi:hypothetical protein AO888_03105 [Pseudomonas aeruginosa]|nr:hypothetical protein AO888_03105 [Pseudomonas aeruginosa]